MTFHRSVTASGELTARRTKADKALETALAEVVLSKQLVVGAGKKRAGSGKVSAGVHEKLEQRTLWLNTALDYQSPAGKLTRLLEKRSVNNVNAVIQHLKYEAVNRLVQGRKMAYSTLDVTFPMDNTSKRWRVEGGKMSESWNRQRSSFQDPEVFRGSCSASQIWYGTQCTS